MFGFLFKKSKGLDKEGKGGSKQSTKDLLGRRNSTTSSTSSGSGSNSNGSSSITLPCSDTSPAIILTPSGKPTTAGNKSFPESQSVNSSQSGKDKDNDGIKITPDKDNSIADTGGGEGKSESVSSQMPIPIVLVSSDEDCHCPYYDKESCTVVEEEHSSPLGGGGGKVDISEGSGRGESEERSCSSQSNSVNGDCVIDNRNSSSSLTNLLTSSTSGIGMSEDALKSLMSDTEIEFIDETLDDACCNNEISDAFDLVHDDGRRKLGEEENDERELKDTERKAMVQLEELRSKLISKETELSLLQADINMLAVDRDNKIMEIEGMSTQLQALRDENDWSLRRIHKLESELEDLRKKNNQLSDDLLKKADQLRCLDGSSMKMDSIDTSDFQLRIKEYESKLRDLESEKNQLIKDRKSYEIEREEEIKAIQEALDDTVAEKNRLQNKFNKDFAELQSANTNMLDDFEWKLRQIESNCKKKVQEKDKQIQEKVKEVKDHMTDEFRTEKERLEQDRHQLKEQLRNVAHLKSHEAELTQLRGLTQEQEKSLRSASRQIDHLKLNEKIVQDELRTLRKLLDQEKAHLTVIQNSAQRRIDFHEENTRSKLDQQKRDMKSDWENKLRDECSKLRRELCRSHAEEKQLALDTMELQKGQELSSEKQKFEKQRQELKQEITKLKEEISKKERECLKEIARATTIADRENMDLRREVEKLSLAHLEELEDIRESHSEEMENLKQRYDSTVEKLEGLEKRLVRFEKLYGPLVDEELPEDKQINEDSTSAKDNEEKSEEEECEESEVESEESEEEEEDNSKSGKGNDAVVEANKKYDSTESLEEIEDEEESGECEHDDLDTSSDNNNKNVVFVVEVKGTPPNSLTVPEISKEDRNKDLVEPPTANTPNSSFISTSISSSPADSESDPKNKKFCLSATNTMKSATNYSSPSIYCSESVNVSVPNPPARRKSHGGRGLHLDGTFPRLSPYGRSRSATMTSCTLA